MTKKPPPVDTKLSIKSNRLTVRTGFRSRYIELISGGNLDAYFSFTPAEARKIGRDLVKRAKLAQRKKNKKR